MNRCGMLLLATALGWVAFDGEDARAATEAGASNPDPVVNQFSTGDQALPAIASAADGRYVVVWQSDDQDGSLSGIYARRYTAAGTAAGDEFRVNNETRSRQSRPSVAMAPDGRFAIAWDSESPQGLAIKLRAFSAAGAARGPELRVDEGTFTVQPQADIAMDAAGGITVVWQERRPLLGLLDQRVVAIRRFDADAVAVDAVQTAHTDLSNPLLFPRVASNAAGQTVVTWLRSDGAGTIQARVYDSNGSALGRAFDASESTDLLVDRPSVAVASDGSFYLAWDSFMADFTAAAVRVRAFSADSQPLGAEYATDARLQRYAGLAIDQADHVALVAHGDGIFLQCLGPDGPLGAARGLDDAAAPYTQLLPRLAPGPISASAWIAVWQGYSDDQDGRDVLIKQASCSS